MGQSQRKKMRWTEANKLYLLFTVLSCKVKNRKPDWSKIQQQFPGLTAQNLQVQFNNLRTRGYLEKHVFRCRANEQQIQLLCCQLMQISLYKY